MNNIENNLFEMFGNKISIEKLSLDLPLPYKNNFNFYSLKGALNCIVIEPITKDILSIKNCFYFVSKDYPNSSLFVFLKTKDTNMIRKLNNLRISYICNGKIFPFSQISISKFTYNDFDLTYTKSTQLVSKFYLFNDVKPYTTKEISRILKISQSSISRANIFLSNLGLLDSIGVNKQAYIVKSKKILLEGIEPYFVLPYRSKIYVPEYLVNNIKQKTYCISGDGAFSYYSNISDMKIKEIAMDLDNYKIIINNKENIKNKSNNFEMCPIYIYWYNPKLLSNNETYIDLVDTYIEMKYRYKNSDDPRIKTNIKNLKEKIIHAKPKICS